MAYRHQEVSTREEVVSRFKEINDEREKMKKIERAIHSVLPNAPFKALFGLLANYNFGALVPSLLDDTDIKMFKEYNETADAVIIHLMYHLRPGAKFIVDSPGDHDFNQSVNNSDNSPLRRSPWFPSMLNTWGRVRANPDLRREIYSFLTAHDRVHLGEVDRAFRNDEVRCTVVGVYGPNQLGLLEAFHVLQRWKDAEDSPLCQNDMEGSWGREGHGEIPESWFTLKSGYDLNRVEVRRRQDIAIGGCICHDQTHS